MGYPPGGETFGQVRNRAAGFLAARKAPPAPAVVASHGGTVRAPRCHCLGIPPGNVFPLSIDFGSRTMRRPGRWNVLTVNG